MTGWLKHIRMVFAILLFAGLSTGCVGSEDIPGQEAGEDVCTLVFTLSPQATTPVTEARVGTWGDPFPESEASLIEQRIDRADIYLITESNNSILFVPEIIDNPEGVSRYRITVPIDADYLSYLPNGMPLLKGKIVAVCNSGVRAAVNPFSETLQFNIKDLNATGFIPMWGVKELSGIPLKPSQSVNAGQINLLRAVPKITIQLADEISEDYEIVSIVPQTNGFPLYGNVVPSGAYSVSDTRQLSIEGCFNASSQSQVAPLNFRKSATGESWVYFPEHICNIEAGMPEYFTVYMRLKGTNTTFSGKIYLCDYKDGLPRFETAFRELVRNHDYRFRINLAKLQFAVSFEEWKFGGKVHIELQ